MKLYMLAAIFASTNLHVGNVSADEKHGPFSSWDNVPAIIESIEGDRCRDQLEQLRELTWIMLGYPQVSQGLTDDEHKLHMAETKERWRQWWESTGKHVSAMKEEFAKVDEASFAIAWDFLGLKTEKPVEIAPVWIPKTWTLYVTFKNGDYQGEEDEIWVVERQAERARASKLRSDFKPESWEGRLVLSELENFSPERADEILKSLNYVHRYAPPHGTAVSDNVVNQLYYPHASLRLRDGQGKVLWNTEGYEFEKTRPEFGEGTSGRSYCFLKSVFVKEKWHVVDEPTSEQLAPYRRFLAFSKPYFSSQAIQVVSLFGEVGGSLEMRGLLDWAEKQKAATRPDADWRVRCDDFSTGATVNVVGFTRLQIQSTLKEIERIRARIIRADEKSAYVPEVKDLKRYVAEMLEEEKAEKESLMNGHPQPLRDLLKADEHPNDSNLKHLSAAIQLIRDNPDPKLFEQLIAELDDGTLRMSSLLKHILLNEHGILDLKDWGEREEAIAVNACIDALPLAKEQSVADLIRILLRVNGGGKISVAGPNGGQELEVVVYGIGYSLKSGSASNPLSIKDAQAELRRLYRNSKR